MLHFVNSCSLQVISSLSQPFKETQINTRTQNILTLWQYYESKELITKLMAEGECKISLMISILKKAREMIKRLIVHLPTQVASLLSALLSSSYILMHVWHCDVFSMRKQRTDSHTTKGISCSFNPYGILSNLLWMNYCIWNTLAILMLS